MVRELWDSLVDRPAPATKLGAVKDFAIRAAVLCALIPFIPFALLHSSKEGREREALTAQESAQPRVTLRAARLRDVLNDETLLSSAPLPSPPVSSSGSPVNEQAQSGLFRLPVEARAQIYAHLIGKSTIHISRASKLEHAKCRSPEGGCRWCAAVRFPYGRPRADTQLARAKRYDDDCADCTFIALLQVCRKVHDEAQGELYRGNTFDFPYVDDFLHFSSSILPYKLYAVSSIRLSTAFYYRRKLALHPSSFDDFDCMPFDMMTWKRTWKVIAGDMPGLRKIYLEIWKSTRTDAPFERLVLEPLNAVKHVPDFDVVLMWGVDDESNSHRTASNVPYRIQRRQPLPKSAFLIDEPSAALPIGK